MFLAVLSFIAQSTSLVLPILIAGASLILVLKKNYFPRLNMPVDSGAKIASKRLFGNNKTWRGVIVYVVVSIACCSLLAGLANLYPAVIHPIFLKSPLFVGVAFSLGYICGELLNSFVKRQRGIAPGTQSGNPLQSIIDNIDGIVIVSIILWAGFNVSLAAIAVAAGTGAVLHLLTDVCMKKIGLKQ